MSKWKNLMRRDMEIKGLAKSTVDNYIWEMDKLAKYYGKAPNKLKLKELLEFQHHMVKTHVSGSRYKMSVAAMRWFFRHTFPKEWSVEKLYYKKERKNLPVVFNRDEIIKILEGCTNLKYKTIISFSYSCGLRISEILKLEVKDIDSVRMLVHVRGGKGGKDRYTPLAQKHLELLRSYYKQNHLKIKDYLFPGKQGHIDKSTVNGYLKDLRIKLGITKHGTFHTLRHSFATHLLEDGVNILVIQRLLGHTSLKTTMIYLHIANNYIKRAHSPLDTLYSEVSIDHNEE
ncbi:MAG: tyrosine-type recombinase/integrase [Candidatus Cloacimonetes bacterium]|nr:tyrosine-type recombinase/integrase [Candidatus Cloacimonadota bacterium]